MIPELEQGCWREAFGETCNMTLTIDRTITCRGSHSTAWGPITAPFTREDVDELYYAQEGENDGQTWIAIGKLRDNRYFSLESGCDYTGWDCQSSGGATVSWELDDVIRYGTTKSARARLGIELPEEVAE